MSTENKSYYCVLGVLLLESFLTLGMLMSWLTSYFIEAQLASDFGLGPVTIIWFRVLLGIMFVVEASLTVLLAKALNRKSPMYLQVWIIAQFVLFILTLVTVILSTMGWMGFDAGYSFIIYNGLSLLYRLTILKLVSNYKEQLPVENENDIDVCDSSKSKNHNNVNSANQEQDYTKSRKRASSSSSIRSASRIISNV